MCASGEVGVLGDDLEVRGDLGAGFDFVLGAGLVTICFTGGTLADDILLVGWALFGAGPEFLTLLVTFSPPPVAFAASLGLEDTSVCFFSCTWAFEGVLLMSFVSDLSFESPLSANADPFKISPNPPCVESF